VVQSDKVDDPVSVRYGWANNPDDANLFNDEGLPASPSELILARCNKIDIIT
jgi:sialate O-acetylesterase